MTEMMTNESMMTHEIDFHRFSGALVSDNPKGYLGSGLPAGQTSPRRAPFRSFPFTFPGRKSMFSKAIDFSKAVNQPWIHFPRVYENEVHPQK